MTGFDLLFTILAKPSTEAVVITFVVDSNSPADIIYHSCYFQEMLYILLPMHAELD